MGNEIAYLMPIKYKIFLGKGALPPYNPRQYASPLDPHEHLAHTLSFPQFKIDRLSKNREEEEEEENTITFRLKCIAIA